MNGKKFIKNVPVLMHRDIFISIRLLFGAEDTVAGVAETGDDIAVFVQLFVHGAAVDIHIGMSLLDVAPIVVVIGGAVVGIGLGKAGVKG